MDFGHTSDPYCKLLLYPPNDMTTKWNFRTTVKKHTLQPEFNEEFIFTHIQLQELISKTLQITVYDKDLGKKDDYIGKYLKIKEFYFSKLVSRLTKLIKFYART
jgi:Ca2+-dependent lipid-binding protein